MVGRYVLSLSLALGGWSQVLAAATAAAMAAKKATRDYSESIADARRLMRPVRFYMV